jgi:hypothetical protein
MSRSWGTADLENTANFFRWRAEKFLAKKSQFPVDKSGSVEYNNQAVANQTADRGA